MRSPTTSPARIPADAQRTAASAAAIMESSDLYRLLVERVRDYAIFALDTTGHVLSWNEGAQRLKGYTANEILGRHFSAFYPDYDIASGKPAWELATAISVVGVLIAYEVI